MVYLYLMIAIVAEVIATTTLRASDSFTKFWPSVVVVIGYSTSFYFLSWCVKWMSIGFVYAVWCGVGIVLVAVLAAIVYKQVPDAWGIVGMGLIVAGVVVLNVLSKTAIH
jgi:small multidrug resistance pump